jgi:tetratricopeptide (TPR) repeat protein
MADRFLYAPSLGFCLAVALILAKYLPMSDKPLRQQNKFLLIGLLVITFLFGGLTLQRNPVWENNTQLFSSDVQVAKNSAKMHYYYANTLLKQFLDKDESQTRNPDAQALRLLDTAAFHFTKSYDINPKFHHSTYNLGLVHIYKKEPQKALKWLQYTLQLQPNHGLSHEQMVRVYGEFLNQPDEALKHLNITLNTIQGQKNASNYQYLGNLMAMKGNISAAEEAFNKAADMRPSIAKNCYQNMAAMYGNLAIQAQNQGNLDLSSQYRQKSSAYQQKSKAFK